MTHPHANPHANNIWSKKKIKKMIIIIAGILFIVSQINLFRISPQFPENDSLPGQVFRITQDNSIGDIHHSKAFFLRNYAAMEREFKVYVYPGGNPRKCYHSKARLQIKYASEHYFFMNLRDSHFFTDNPHVAHLFFIPIFCKKMGGMIVSPGYQKKAIEKYVQSLISKYPYWNRTLGADHFFVSCHDIASGATEEVPFLLKNAIRLLCSPSYNSNYVPHKLAVPPDWDDMWNTSPMQIFRSTALPRAFLLSPEKIYPPRTKLGFWAGAPNSDVRKKLLCYFKGVPDFEFHFVDKMKRAAVLDAYQNELYGSKFCICPRGKNVGGVCLTESMAFGCIPVILSDYYDLPFTDILDWNNFSVILKEDDVPNLEKILKGIPEEKYKKMHQNLLQVREHFKWHSPPVKYDEFHMVMYELWKRRHITRY